MNADFKFDVDDRVITPFGDEGIVGFVGKDSETVKYFVKTKEGCNWFKESDLKKGVEQING